MDIDKEFRLSTLSLIVVTFLVAGRFLYLWQRREEPLAYHNTVLLGGDIVLFLLGIAALVLLFVHYRQN